MIERKFVAEKKKEFQIQETIAENVKGSGYSHTKLQRTPLGEKIVIFAAKPGLIVGRKGQNISSLTKEVKSKFKLENPQIEISEIEHVNLDAQVVADNIAQSLERFGTSRFKGIMHKTMDEVMSAGALGIEIVISGKIPGSRAKSWRVYSGYLKKCGDIAITSVRKAKVKAVLKTGVVGVKVSIMPPGIRLPDNIEFIEEPEVVSEPSAPEEKPEAEEPGKNEKPSSAEEPKETGEEKKEQPKKARKPAAPRKQPAKKKQEKKPKQDKK